MGKVLLITIGSRGDIQPFVALAQGLMAAGHTVALQTAEAYRGFVEGHGVPYAQMSNDFIELTESKEGQAATDGGGKLALLKKVMPMLRQMLDDEWLAASAFQPDCIVYHPKALGGAHLAEKLGIPAMIAMSLPLYTPTRAYPTPILANLRLGGTVNRWSYALMGMATAPYAGVVNAFRQSLGLKPRGRFANDFTQPDGSPTPTLYAYSPHLLPVPKDYPPQVQVTGAWVLPHQASWQPPAELVRFLEAGAPPVYVGFGSMSGSKAAERADIVLAALAQAGVRGLLARGWGGLKPSALPNEVFMLDEAPHAWLFPRVSAVVHHGGAGTTDAGLRAGKPTVIVPFIADQPFWGRVVHEAGLGSAPIAQNRLTVENLAAAIRQVTTDAAIRARAEQVGAAMRAEDGVGQAVERVGRVLSRR
ncbi:MAG: glycosyltransferase [Anaerolineae bacterium]|nr:glycosyltransferase [Anaerolineae bacterium]